MSCHSCLSTALNRLAPPYDPHDADQADCRRPRAHGGDLGGDGPDRLERSRRRHRGRRRRPAAQRDDRPVGVRVLDRSGDARVQHLRYRAKPGDESDGGPIPGNTVIEMAWTLIPTVIVLFGAAYSWVILDKIEARESDRLEVDVTAQQF